ncbi:hypothetical protein ACHQM5_000854 [Ranunculus cassubicifolius]
MENSSDFLQLLGPDVSSNILSCLDDPADLIRASSVSRSWQQFVTENCFCKRLCLKKFPGVSRAIHAIEVNSVILPKSVGSSSDKLLDSVKRNHTVYAILARVFSPELRNDCISWAIDASTTDNYEVESIQNTLVPEDFDDFGRYSYWSSKGIIDDKVPETLTYRLISNLCLVTAINIQPFQAHFQEGSPIYSSKYVKFQIGCHDSRLTYESPVFPMSQANCLQKFELPEPVLCIGGILQIELSGGVQRQESDDLFYICLRYVQVEGRTLLPGFDAQYYFPGQCVISYLSSA